MFVSYLKNLIQQKYIFYALPLVQIARSEKELNAYLFEPLTVLYGQNSVQKSGLVGEPWDFFYICVVAPEVFCLLFSVYNVVKAGLLYEKINYNNSAKSNLLKLRGISITMCRRLRRQLRWTFFFFLNPVIWDRVMVIFNGFLMCHALISTFKLFFLLLFRVLLLFFYNYVIANGVVVSLEIFCLLSFMVFLGLLVFGSNHFLLTIVLFEAFFFCLLPIMVSSYRLQPAHFACYRNSSNGNTSKYFRFFDKICVLREEKNLLYSTYTSFGVILYFLYNVFFLSLYLFALIFFFFFSYGISYSDIHTTLLHSGGNGQYSIYILVLIFLILSMFFFKIGVVPFHWWMVSLISSLNVFPLMIVLVPFKLLAFFTCIRLIFGVFQGYFFFIKPMLILLGLISMVLGALGMFFQLHIRRFLVFSTINNSGYILLALSGGNCLAFKALIIYLFVYLITTLGFLIYIGSTINGVTGKPLSSFVELINYSSVNSITTFYFCVILLSMAGIPPLAGFWAKFYVMESLVSFGYWGYFSLFVIIITSGLTSVGYLRVIKLFFVLPSKSMKIVVWRSYSEYTLRILLKVTFFLLFFGFFITIWWWWGGSEIFYLLYCYFRLIL